MANLIVICGPQAVGKMTVAESLRDKLKEYLTGLCEQFTSGGGNFYFVELAADMDTRLKRNETPHRMERKASKRNMEWSRMKWQIL